MGKRPFNKDAYNATDSKCKIAAVEMMKGKGFEPIVDINIENYQKWDLKFYNQQQDKTLIIENEMRENFDVIKKKFSTVHIPIRKRLSPADYYIVWHSNLQEFILIENKLLTSSPIVSVKCKEWGRPEESYTEDMVDVPKKSVSFYKKVGTKWKLQ